MGSPELEEAVLIEEPMTGVDTKNATACDEVKETAEVVVKPITRGERGSPLKQTSTMPG